MVLILIERYLIMQTEDKWLNVETVYKKVWLVGRMWTFILSIKLFKWTSGGTTLLSQFSPNLLQQHDKYVKSYRLQPFSIRTSSSNLVPLLLWVCQWSPSWYWIHLYGMIYSVCGWRRFMARWLPKSSFTFMACGCFHYKFSFSKNILLRQDNQEMAVVRETN